MSVRIFLALAVIAALFWAYHRQKKLPPKQRRAFIFQSLLYAFLVFCIVAIISGRMHWLMAIPAGLLAFAKVGFGTLLRLVPFLSVMRKSDFLGSPSFKTRFLDVKVDLKNGQISGTVLDGPHASEDLLSLSMAQLNALEKYYEEHDRASYFLIRVIRQRQTQYQQRDHNSAHDYAAVGDPSVEEAMQILGLAGKPSKQEVIKAHRKLMQKLHPDRGGNDYLASRVNLAKETLIKYLAKR